MIEKNPNGGIFVLVSVLACSTLCMLALGVFVYL